MDEEERMQMLHGNAIAAANAARFNMMSQPNPMAMFGNPNFAQAQSYFQNLASQHQAQQQEMLRQQQLARNGLGSSGQATGQANNQGNDTPSTSSNPYSQPLTPSSNIQSTSNSNTNSYHSTPSHQNPNSIKQESSSGCTNLTPTTPGRNQLPQSDSNQSTTPIGNHRSNRVADQIQNFENRSQNLMKMEPIYEDLDRTLTNENGNTASNPCRQIPQTQTSGSSDNSENLNVDSNHQLQSTALANLTNKLLAAKTESGISSNSPLSNNSSNNSSSNTPNTSNFPAEFKNLLNSISKKNDLGQEALMQLAAATNNNNLCSPSPNQLAAQALALQAEAKAAQAKAEAANAAAAAAQAAAAATAALPLNSPISRLFNLGGQHE